EAARLRPGEEDDLAATIDRLSHSQALRGAAALAHAALESRAGDAVGDAIHALRAAPGSALVEAAATAAGLQEQLADLARALRGLAEAFDEDPDALEAA